MMGAAALLIAAGLSSEESAQAAQQPSQQCQIHVYPAEGVHSVGEDFDAVHQVDQDLHHYYETAGRSLDWLTPVRQTALLGAMPLDEFAGVSPAMKTVHAESLSRHQALEPGPRELGTGCVLDVMLPQVMLERGGLAGRSLRLFGVVRRYENGALVKGYSGFAAGSMAGFQLKSAADADSATAVVENAYRTAVETLLRNSAKPPRK